MTTNERPIIFSGPMVRAILDGRKTQTRRVVKPQPIGFHGGVRLDCHTFRRARRPALWVRERHAFLEVMRRAPPQQGFEWDLQVEYSDGTEQGRAANGEKPKLPRERGEQGWRPGMFMPRWASRITLDVTGVRVERLQDISSEDCAAEGIEPSDVGDAHEEAAFNRAAYAELWDSINAKRAPWASNPWVWVVEFRKLP